MEVCLRLVKRGEKVRALVRSTSAPEKVEALRAAGVDLAYGDLKDSASLASACNGADAVISTASSTLSRQAGDSIESVDAAGQLALVSAAKTAGIKRFIYLSYRGTPGISIPLTDAKRAVEAAIADMNYTVIQASWFMEVWLGSALGFDYANGAVRIYGTGEAPVSWVSFRDVAEMCAVALRHPAAERKTIEFGGPEALTPLEVVALFERLSGKRFSREHVPEVALRAQLEAAQDSMQKSFAGLMLGCVNGDAMNMAPVMQTFGVRPTRVEDYARTVLGLPASAG